MSRLGQDIAEARKRQQAQRSMQQQLRQVREQQGQKYYGGRQETVVHRQPVGVLESLPMNAEEEQIQLDLALAMSLSEL